MRLLVVTDAAAGGVHEVGAALATRGHAVTLRAPGERLGAWRRRYDVVLVEAGGARALAMAGRARAARRPLCVAVAAPVRGPIVAATVHLATWLVTPDRAAAERCGLLWRHAARLSDLAVPVRPDDPVVDAWEALLGRLAAGALPAPERTPIGTVRARPPAGRWRSLDDRDVATLSGVLQREVDMAYRRRAPVLLDWLELADGQRVLDCGCGMGFYLLMMSRLRRLRLVGVDMDAFRATQAQEAADAALVRADFQRLPFADGAFDRVLMSETLEHVPDDVGALREVHRVLAPGGVVALSVPHVAYPFWWDPLHRAWTALGGAPPRTGPVAGMWSNHVRLYWPEDVVARLTAAGFTVDDVEEQTHHALPLSHFLVYGIGKPLLEQGLLPAGLAARADRLQPDAPRTGVDPFDLVRALFRAVDRRNDGFAVARHATFVSILVRARKAA
jgi:SAM-dependent methyltransferase